MYQARSRSTSSGGSPNRSLVIVDDEAAEGTVRYRLLDSIRAFALDAMTDAGMREQARAAHCAWFAEAADSSTQGVRSSRQAEHLAFARAERANLDAALAWSTVHQPLRRAATRQRIRLGVGRLGRQSEARSGSWRRSRQPATPLPIRDRADALLLAAWIEASIGRLDRAREHIAVATEAADAINDVDLQARCCYYLAYVVSHDGEFRRALELTDRSDALYAELDRPWDQAANWLFAARAAISANDEQRSVEAVDQVERWLRAVDDPWLHVRRDAVLGELARIQRRFDDAVVHLESRRGSFATPRIPADGGVPVSQPRASPVPGR